MSGHLTDKVIEYNRIIGDLVKAAKEPGFGRSSWAPLEALIAVHDFERVGILREVMTWDDYVTFLTGWAKSKDFFALVRRVTEVGTLVFFEAEEHHEINGEERIVNSMNVFDFDTAGKIRHLDIYLQGQLYEAGTLPAYVQTAASGSEGGRD